MSDGPRMGWYDLGMVREGLDFKVDIREYFFDSKIFRWTQEKLI